MTEKVYLARCRNKKDTEENWLHSNPVLLDGEIAYVEMADGRIRSKIGDGETPYDMLHFDDEKFEKFIEDNAVIYAGDYILNGTTFADVDDNGNVVIKEDGSGDYLLTITILGVVLARYIGNEVTDKVTGQKYSFTISNGIVELKEII